MEKRMFLGTGDVLFSFNREYIGSENVGDFPIFHLTFPHFHHTIL